MGECYALVGITGFALAMPVLPTWATALLCVAILLIVVRASRPVRRRRRVRRLAAQPSHVRLIRGPVNGELDR